MPCALLIAATLAVLHAYREPLAATGAENAVVEKEAMRRLAKWRERPATRPRIVLFGDSLDVCTSPPATKVDTVAGQLRTAMGDAGDPVDVVDLTQPGMQPIHFYALLDDALAAPAALVVLELNLRDFLDPRLRPGEARLTGLVRKIGFSGALRVRATLEREGLTILDPPLTRLKEQLGLLYVFEGAREGATDWLKQLGAGVTQALQLPRKSLPSFTELNRRLQLSYMVDYAGHPNAAPFRAAIEDLHRARIPVLVYVSPANEEAMRVGGDFDEDLLAQRLEAFRVAIGASPAEWLDLHDRLPIESFRDHRNHMRLEGCTAVGRQLAERALLLLTGSTTRPSAVIDPRDHRGSPRSAGGR